MSNHNIKKCICLFFCFFILISSKSFVGILFSSMQMLFSWSYYEIVVQSFLWIGSRTKRATGEGDCGEDRTCWAQLFILNRYYEYALSACFPSSRFQFCHPQIKSIHSALNPSNCIQNWNLLTKLTTYTYIHITKEMSLSLVYTYYHVQLINGDHMSCR